MSTLQKLMQISVETSVNDHHAKVFEKHKNELYLDYTHYVKASFTY